MTQEILAENIGISRASLASIETGRQNILVHQLYTFASALNLEITDILPNIPKPTIDSAHTLTFSSMLNRSQKEWILNLLDSAEPAHEPKKQSVKEARRDKRS